MASYHFGTAPQCTQRVFSRTNPGPKVVVLHLGYILELSRELLKWMKFNILLDEGGQSQ